MLGRICSCQGRATMKQTGNGSPQRRRPCMRRTYRHERIINVVPLQSQLGEWRRSGRPTENKPWSMYHRNKAVANSLLYLSMYCLMRSACGFCSGGYAVSLWHRDARLAKSRYCSARVKAGPSCPCLTAKSQRRDQIRLEGCNSQSVSSTSGRNCSNLESSSVPPRAVPGTSAAIAL
jgi:hypothetical protein